MIEIYFQWLIIINNYFYRNYNHNTKPFEIAIFQRENTKGLKKLLAFR